MPRNRESPKPDQKGATPNPDILRLFLHAAQYVEIRRQLTAALAESELLAQAAKAASIVSEAKDSLIGPAVTKMPRRMRNRFDQVGRTAAQIQWALQEMATQLENTQRRATQWDDMALLIKGRIDHAIFRPDARDEAKDILDHIYGKARQSEQLLLDAARVHPELIRIAQAWVKARYFGSQFEAEALLNQTVKGNLLRTVRNLFDKHIEELAAAAEPSKTRLSALRQ